MSDIPAVDPEAIRRRRLEAERTAEVRSEELRRRETWLVALRVALSVGLLVVSFFPIIGEKRTSKQHVVWEYFGAIVQWPQGTLVGLWTLVTLLLVVAALVTPGGRVGRRRQWVTLAFLITFGGGHFILAAMGNGSSRTTVLAAYWVLVGLSVASAVAWFPRQDIDARE